MIAFLLFLIGLFLVPAVIGGFDLVYYVIDLLKYRRAIRKAKFDKRIEVVVKESTAIEPPSVNKETKVISQANTVQAVQSSTINKEV